MTRVALYARYSSDNQRDASIEDQFRICREQAKREKWKIVGTYKDAGISGASMILCPGIQALLQDAQAGQFDIVLAEALDHISRDQADVATLFKHLSPASNAGELRCPYVLRSSQAWNVSAIRGWTTAQFALRRTCSSMAMGAIREDARRPDRLIRRQTRSAMKSRP
ncbi:recombinase family protein [Amaricoccus sp.]|uniref:recombinase family protein n=1 Tax=Amaricoccus sp. TaxID=1872485 RepID=UPI0039E712EE